VYSGESGELSGSVGLPYGLPPPWKTCPCPTRLSSVDMLIIFAI